MPGQFIRGSLYLFAGLRLLMQPGLRRFVLVPMAINASMFLFVIYFAIQWFGGLLDWILKFVPESLQWLEWLLWPLFALTIAMFVFATFSWLMNLIAAPFNDILAERTEKMLFGAPHRVADIGSSHWWKDAARSISHEFGKFLYMSKRGLALLILFLIPGLNLVAAPLWMIFSAWMLALEYIDYPSNNAGMDLVGLRAWMREKKALAFGFGIATLLATLLPVINFLVMPAAVAGATKMYVEQSGTNSSRA